MTLLFHALSRFGADQHLNRTLAAEALLEKRFHFMERPQENQVSVDSKDLLSRLHPSHLSRYKQTDNNKTERTIARLVIIGGFFSLCLFFFIYKKTNFRSYSDFSGSTWPDPQPMQILKLHLSPDEIFIIPPLHQYPETWPIMPCKPFWALGFIMVRSWTCFETILFWFTAGFVEIFARTVKTCSGY